MMIHQMVTKPTLKKKKCIFFGWHLSFPGWYSAARYVDTYLWNRVYMQLAVAMYTKETRAYLSKKPAN